MVLDLFVEKQNDEYWAEHQERMATAEDVAKW